MNYSARILVIGLAFAALTTLGAPEKPKFNPDEALGFLEALGTVKMYDTRDNIVYYDPDVNLLARLFKARYAPGAGDNFVDAVETFVSAGLLVAKRSDLYFKRVKPMCKVMDAEELERKVMKSCGNCREGKISKNCSACKGSGRCSSCDGQGRIRTNITTLYDSRFPGDTRVLTTKCGFCRETGRCSRCKGTGKVDQACPKCAGRGHLFDEKAAAFEYALNALALIKHLCDVGDQTDMPDLLKRDFKKARENAEKKFPLLRQAREEEEAEARAEQERKEKEEQERREKEAQAERERKEKEERKAFEAEQLAKGNVGELKVKCTLELNDGRTITPSCSAYRGEYSKWLEEHFREAVSARREVIEKRRLWREAEAHADIAGAYSSATKETAEAFSAEMKYTSATTKLASAQISLFSTLEYRMTDDAKVPLVNGICTIKDIPKGVKYTYVFNAKYGSNVIIWVKSLTLENSAQEITLSNDGECYITDQL